MKGCHFIRLPHLAVFVGCLFAVGAGLRAAAYPAEDAVAVRNSIARYNAGKMHFDRYWNTYHESAVYKIYLKSKKQARAQTTLDQAMDFIRAIHDFSGGMHQIVYLVGWQYDGHDSKYPSWDEVGDHCRASFSQDPRESLRAMMREAREKYNADVSLHINMNDAYTNSPLWKTYLDNDLLCRDAKGRLVEGGVFGGEQSYPISHLKEWRAGFAQKRILRLLEMLPELKEARTIHIDALFGSKSPGDGIGFEEDVAAINACTEFWHEQGLDVTIEFLPSYDQIGYFPYFFHLNLDERCKVLYPPSLVCGGAGWSCRDKLDYYNVNWRNNRPGAGCVYVEAWGAGHWNDLSGKIEDIGAFLSNVFHTMVLTAYYNRSRPVEHRVDAETYTVRRENGVVAAVRMRDRALTVSDNGRTVVSGGDFFLDFPYGGGTILAFSEKGCDRTFRLPPSFAGVTKLRGTRYPGGTDCSFVTEDDTVRLALPPRTSLVLLTW